MLSELGYTQFYDVTRANLAVENINANEQIAQARKQENVMQLCDALMTHGLVLGLQGEYIAARRCFAQVEDLRPQDTLRVWRAKSYAYVIMRHRYGSFPDGRDTTVLDIIQRFDMLEYAEPVVQQLNQLRQRLHSKGIDVALEHRVIDGWLTSLLSSRSSVSKTHPNSDEIRPKLLETFLHSVWSPTHMADQQQHGALIAHSYWLAADLCHRADDYSQAQQYLQEAQQRYHQLSDTVGIALCDMTKVDWQVAPLSTPLVWNCVIEEGIVTSELSLGIEQREFVTAGVDLETVTMTYQRIRDRFAQDGATRAVGQVEMRLAFVAVLQEAYEQAEERLDSAENALTQVGDQMALQYLYIQRALLGIAAGRVPERRDLAQQVGQWGARSGAFAFSLGLGIFCLRMGRYWLARAGSMEQAVAAFRLAEHLFIKIEAPISAACAFSDRATVYQFLGDINAAGQLFEKATIRLLHQLQTNKANRDMLLYRLIYLEGEVSQLYTRIRDPEGIERSTQRLYQLDHYLPFDLHNRNEDEVMTGLMQQTITGNIDQAEAATQLGIGLRLMQLLDDAAVNIPLYRGKRVQRAGDQQEANRHFAEALHVARVANDALHSDLRKMRLISVLGSMNRNEEAETLFRQTMQLGETESSFNQWTKRLGLDQKFGNLINQRNANKHINAATFFVRLKRYNAAKEQFAIVAEIIGKQWWRNQARPWEVLIDYGEMYAGLEQYEDALMHFDEAISLLESQRSMLRQDELKVALMGDRLSYLLYLEAAKAALKAMKANPARQRDYLAQSFDYVEAGKGRALLDLMNLSMSAAKTPNIANELIARWRSVTAHLATWRGLLTHAKEADPPIQSQINTFEQQIVTAENELRQLEEQLASENPKFFELLNPLSQPLTLSETIAALPDETLFVEYFFDDQSLLLWTLTGKGESYGELIETDTFALNGQVNRFYALCRDPDSDLAEIEVVGQRIAATLLDPISKWLEHYRRVIFVPHAILHRLPFHALRWRGKLLVETHVVSYRPNAGSLRYVGVDRLLPTSSCVLAIGNPSKMMVPFYLDDDPIPASSLLGAEKEAESIAGIFPNSLSLTRRDATENEVRRQLSNFNILHFGTHGYLSREAPMLSSILLANGEALTVAELAGIELNADLVVLSACSTALGQQTGGDEIIGLTRGLLGAGAKSVIVTIWPVDDKSTPQLMIPFYKNLKSGDISPAHALHVAQQHLRGLTTDSQDSDLREVYLRDLERGKVQIRRHNYQHPFYWAPFILVG